MTPAAETLGKAHSKGAFATPSSPSSRLRAAGRAGQLNPTAASPVPASTFPTPMCSRDPWEGGSGSLTAGGGWPSPHASAPPSPSRATWRPQRGAQCVPPRSPGAASLRAAGAATSQAYCRRARGWERGGEGGWEQAPGLTCSPAGGWGRRGRGEGAPTPGTCGGAHNRGAASPPSPSPAGPQSCAVGLTGPGAVPVLGPGAGET